MCYHTSVIIDENGEHLGKYRKMHIPDDLAYYEKFYSPSGNISYKVFQTKYAKIGVCLGSEWYPKAIRIASFMGSEILFYPTAIG